jgi:uridine kinase
MTAVVIGFCGGSCSGKSALVDAVAEVISPLAPARLSFDRYYRPLDHLSLQERHRVNFDHPDSLDDELFLEHLRALGTGRPIGAPRYDFAKHRRRPEPEPIAPSSVLLVDGILLLAMPPIVALLDWTVFLEVPEALRLERRIARDAVERGRSEESVRRQFAESVRPMHERFVQPSAAVADVVVRWPADFELEAARLAAQIRSLRSARN